MKYFSMFTGIGGFDLALNRLSHNCIGYSEIDKYAIQVYSKHFKGVKNYGDATKIKPEEIPDFDLLVGGFPCQAFSIAGKRGGFEDTRGTLFFEISRIIKRKQPGLFLLENVKGFLNHDAGNTFTKILQTIDELGYDAEWQILNSKHFGVPQNRERVFIIGYLRGTSRQQIFPLRKGNQIYTGYEKRLESETKPASTITTKEGGRKESNFIVQTDKEIEQKNIQIEIKSKFQKTVYSVDGISPTVREGHGDVIRILDGYNRRYTKEIGTIRQNMLNGGSLIQLNNPTHSSDRVYDSKGIAKTLRRGSNTGFYFTQVHNMQPRSPTRPYLKYSSGGSGHLQRDDISYCLDGGRTNGIKFNDKSIRRLIPIECERLQGFPDNWTQYGIDDNGKKVEISDTQRYKCLGNAVTVNVIEAIVKQLK